MKLLVFANHNLNQPLNPSFLSGVFAVHLCWADGPALFEGATGTHFGSAGVRSIEIVKFRSLCRTNRRPQAFRCKHLSIEK